MLTCLLIAGSCRGTRTQEKMSDDALAKRYLETVVELEEAAKAKRDTDKLWDELGMLRRAIAPRADKVLAEFIPAYLQLPNREQRLFLWSGTWAFNTKKGFGFLAARLEGDLTWETVRISKLLGQRAYGPAKKAVAEAYRKAVASSERDKARILAVAVVRLGEMAPLLDLLAQVEAGGESAAQSVWALGPGIVRACAGPLLELYARTPRKHPHHPLQARILASRLNLGWRFPQTEAKAVKIVDAWLKTDAAAEAKFSSYSSLGELSVSLKKYKRASGYWRKALHIKPKDPKALCQTAVTLGLSGQAEEALGVANRLLEVSPESSQAWSVRACSKVLLGRDRAAISDFRKALELDPGNYLALRDLHSAYTRLGLTEKAAEIKRRLDATTRPASTRSAS